MQRTEQRNPKARRGVALMFSLFIIFIVTLMTVNVLDTETLQLSGLRNAMDYERALYLANAGVHNVAAQLEADTSWRGTVTEGAYPSDDTYSATAVDGATGMVIVTSSGVAGDVTRSLQAIIEL